VACTCVPAQVQDLESFSRLTDRFVVFSSVSSQRGKSAEAAKPSLQKHGTLRDVDVSQICGFLISDVDRPSLPSPFPSICNLDELTNELRESSK